MVRANMDFITTSEVIINTMRMNFIRNTSVIRGVDEQVVWGKDCVIFFSM
jgi:hypothetical protein